MSEHDSYKLAAASGRSPESVTAARLRGQLERTARPCGCKSGAALTVIAVLGWPVWIWLSLSVRTIGDVVVGVIAYTCVIVTAGAMGKVAGMVFGRWRQRRLRRRLTTLTAGR